MPSYYKCEGCGREAAEKSACAKCSIEMEEYCKKCDYLEKECVCSY